MAVEPTRFSRVSVGWRSSTQSLIDVDAGDSGVAFSVIGGMDLVKSALSVSGAATFQSTVSTRGTLTAGTFLAQSAATFNSTLSADGAATFQSTLTTRGTATFGTMLAQSAATFNSTVSANGAATFQSTVSARGQVNADSGVQIGGGILAQIISTATAAVSLGAISPHDSSSVQTVGLSGLSRGDALFLSLDAPVPLAAADRDITWMCSSSSTVGEAHIWGINSTITSVTPTASTFVRLTRIKFGNWPAA